ncbi:MAG TPA: hypothetical protein VF503_10030 [Sphingobium sp.]|uniref:hypothetical protein n=1 Tax=Sphingobium sp. TaxID=1912891 RepID=UPI002ED1C674
MLHAPCRISLIIAASAGMLLTVPHAHAQQQRTVEVHPYLGLDQTVVADLKGGTGDTQTYTSAIVGVDANVRTRSSEINANLSYQHQFSWSDNSSDADVVSGLVRARSNFGTRSFNLEGGALATRVRTDGLTGANGNLASPGAKSNIYSLYAGPTYRGRIGDLDVRAAYRLGYNRLEDGYNTALATTPGLNSFDESWNQYATASVGMQPDVWLPIGWSVGVGYQREDASQLDQRFENAWGRLDITVPLTSDLAAIGGIGYQSIKASNRDALRDSSGAAIIDSNGRFVTDPASPRLLSYDNENVIWDVGILWRPSRRTSLRLTYGHQYGSGSVQGSFNWQPDQNTSLNISLYDSIDSFGRALSGNLANLPDNFLVTRNPFSGDVNGCAFGSSSNSCFSDTLSGIRTANYRNRGVAGSFVHRQGPWNYGIGFGYSRRKFLGDDPVYAGISGLKEENYFAAAALGYAIDGRSGINVNLYANQFNSELPGVADVFNAGAYLTYHRRISRGLQANASVGLDYVKASGVDSVLSGLAQIGVRYSF